MIEKTVNDSLTETVHTVRPEDINGYGRLYGGRLMEWIDELAGVVSRRHCGLVTTTASIDTLHFKAPAYQNDLLVLIGRVTHVGRSSMEVRIDTYVEDIEGMRHPINRAFLVMVAIDENGKPIPVPGLKRESISDEAAWENGEKRYALRKKRHAEGF